MSCQHLKIRRVHIKAPISGFSWTIGRSAFLHGDSGGSPFTTGPTPPSSIPGHWGQMSLAIVAFPFLGLFWGNERKVKCLLNLCFIRHKEPKVNWSGYLFKSEWYRALLLLLFGSREENFCEFNMQTEYISVENSQPPPLTNTTFPSQPALLLWPRHPRATGPTYFFFKAELNFSDLNLSHFSKTWNTIKLS